MQKLPHFFQRLRRDPAVFVLNGMQGREQNGALRGIAREVFRREIDLHIVGEIRLSAFLNDLRAAVFYDPCHLQSPSDGVDGASLEENETTNSINGPTPPR